MNTYRVMMRCGDSLEGFTTSGNTVTEALNGEPPFPKGWEVASIVRLEGAKDVLKRIEGEMEERYGQEPGETIPPCPEELKQSCE